MIVKDAPGKEPILLGYHNAGDFVGMVSLLNESPRTASALALEPTTLLTISRDDFWRLMHEDTLFLDVVIATLIERLLIADATRQRTARWEFEILERFASLSDEHQRMAEVLQLRHEMTNFIVHDLRSPLSLIAMSHSMIEAEVDVEPGSDLEKCLLIARTNIARMLNLVETILEVERVDSDDLQLAPVSLVELVGDAIANTRPLAEAKGIELVFDSPVELPPQVQADYQRIDRLLTNLVDNALKFTPSGGRITFCVWQDAGAVLVSVNDTGPGVSDSQRERIFTRFVQGDDADPERRGFGLGLAYCRAAATAHGGRIWAEDGDDGSGTKFVFALPLQP
jgi:signal transduction histidine kinase